MPSKSFHREFNRDKAVRSIVWICDAMGCRTGMGVISRSLVFTAAHCLPKLPDPAPWTSDEVIVRLRSELDSSLDALYGIISVDPCCDVAVLSEFPSDYSFIEERDKAKLDLSLEPTMNGSIPVHSLLHNSRWLTGRTEIHDPFAATLSFQLDDPIVVEESDGGANIMLAPSSGTPVFNEEGLVLGIMSNAAVEADASVREIHTLVIRRLSACIPPFALPFLH